LTFAPDTLANYIKDTQLSAVSVAAGGSGYTVGDQLTAVGGTFTTPATFTVTSVNFGSITGIKTRLPGSYSAPPTSPVSVTGGTGSNAKLTLFFGNTIDENSNAGLNLLRGGDPINGTLLTNNYPTGAI